MISFLAGQKMLIDLATQIFFSLFQIFRNLIAGRLDYGCPGWKILEKLISGGKGVYSGFDSI